MVRQSVKILIDYVHITTQILSPSVQIFNIKKRQEFEVQTLKLRRVRVTIIAVEKK